MHQGFFTIDTHTHLGKSSISGIDVGEGELLAGLAENGVDAALVFPHGFQDQGSFAVHDRIAKMAEENPGKIFGACCVNPRLGREIYRAEARRCVEELGFRALKLDPVVHALPIDHKTARVVFEAAAELGVAAIVHTGGSGFADPLRAIPVAREFPQLPIVLAHAGFLTYFDQMLLAARTCPNIYADCSWISHVQFRNLVAAMGADRVMLGSDHLSNLPIELSKVDLLLRTEEEKRRVLSQTAIGVFHLPQAQACK